MFYLYVFLLKTINITHVLSICYLYIVVTQAPHNRNTAKPKFMRSKLFTMYPSGSNYNNAHKSCIQLSTICVRMA